MCPRRFTCLAAMTALVAVSGEAHADPSGLVPLAVFPSEVGFVVQPSETNFAFGWSWQVPFTPDLRNRVVADVDLLVRSSGVSSARGRLGYRYSLRHVLGGVGVGLIPGAVTVSPELGARFAHLEPDHHDLLDLSLHTVVRADLATTGAVSMSVLVGWNLF